MAAEEHDEPATMAQVKAIVRRRLRRQVPEDENFLNIYPMMDMMTILLVFLIAQFAAANSEVVQSAELEIPFSTSATEMEDSLPITISRSEIMVDGDATVPLRDGNVDPSQKQGGGTGFLITPLLTAMEKHRDHLKLIQQARSNEPFRGEVRIIADGRTPFRTLAEVIYTLGQAEFKSLHFVVLQNQGGGD